MEKKAIHVLGHVPVLTPVLMLTALCNLTQSCTPQEDRAGDLDTGEDSASETVSDSDSDGIDENCTECDGPVCIAKITGTVQWADGTPLEGENTVKFCAPGCSWISTDRNGNFAFDLQGGCVGFDFNRDLPLMIEIPPELEPEINHYIMALAPTKEQVSNLGEDDFTLDLGLHTVHPVPESVANYTAANGASVSSAGLHFEVAPGELGKADLDLQILKAPIDEWKPPFIDNPYIDGPVDAVNALYYVAPYWTQVATGNGIVYQMDPPAGWSENDPGKAYVLGDWYNFFLKFPSGEIAPRGEFLEWGAIAWVNGKIVTPPIPVLGWLGIAKD